MKVILGNIFSSLMIKNFRLYFFGQMVSLSGTWMQSIALSWLAYELTGTGTALGVTLSLQYLPLLLFGVFGGYFVDRLPKYKMLFITQGLYSVIPFVVAFLIFNNGISIWWLYIASLWQGLIRIIDNPLRQSFISQIVPKENIKNAISLYSTSSNVARIFGPVLAGLVLAKFGPEWCFLVNGISFYIVIIQLWMMDITKFIQPKEVRESTLKLSHSLKYVWHNRVVRDTLFVGVLCGIFVLTFQTIFPIFSKQIFQTNVEGFSYMMSFYGLGAIVGGLFAAQDMHLTRFKVKMYSVLLGASYCLLSLAQSLEIFLLLVSVLGFFTIQVTSSANALIRLHTVDYHVGLTSALWTMAIIGMSAVGSFLVGYWSDTYGIRLAVTLGGFVFVLPIIFLYKSKTKKPELAKA